MNDKPFSQACENNKDPILEVLIKAFAEVSRVLEIGSGTGQHAVHFAAKLPHLVWLTSDLKENHAGIRAWIDEYSLSNLLPPVELDVCAASWPVDDFDAAFSANTAHIMHWPEVAHMFRGIAESLSVGGMFVLYGPFNYKSRFTSESNARFDASLRACDPGMGIRDFESVDALARKGELMLVDDVAMPANNRTLVWRKT